MSGLFEQAPAQDEREAFEAHMRLGGYGNPEKHQDGSYVSSAMELWWQGWKARATRPAQTEQQPELVMPVALGSVNADYDKGWADHAAEVKRLNAELLPSTPC